MEQEERRENAPDGWSAVDSGTGADPSADPTRDGTDSDIFVDNVFENSVFENRVTADSLTPFERAAETARTQANQAASALRRGEFTQNAAIDPVADGDDKLIGLLCYIVPGLMPMIVLLSSRSQDKHFQRYHAVQSLSLTIVVGLLALSVAVGVAILQIIPPLGWLALIMVLCLSPIAFAMLVVMLGYYGRQAYQGKRFAIPGLTTMIRNQGWL